MKVDQIRSVPLFSTLTDDEFSPLAHIFVVKAYRKNQVIFLEEETGTYMYLVLSGKVKVAKAGAGGKETILAIHRAGDFFGEMSLLDGKTAPATVSAMEDSKIISVSGTDFHKYLLHNEKVMLQIIQVLCARLRQVWQTQSLSSSTADARIRMGIHQLAKRHGIRDAHGTIIDQDNAPGAGRDGRHLQRNCDPRFDSSAGTRDHRDQPATHHPAGGQGTSRID